MHAIVCCARCPVQAAVTLREHPGTTVVTDSVTSNGLADFITALGGKHLRCACVWYALARHAGEHLKRV